MSMPEDIESTLAELGGPNWHAAMLHLTEDRGEEIRPHLMEWYGTHTEPAVRSRLLEVISEWGAKVDIPIFLEAASAADKGVFRAAVMGLIRSGDEAAMRRAEELVISNELMKPEPEFVDYVHEAIAQARRRGRQ